jgi:hypothetical protein
VWRWWRVRDAAGTFPGSQREVVLGTAPTEPLTHWYQVRCMLRAPLALGVGHVLTGSLRFEANEARGYNVYMKVVNVRALRASARREAARVRQTQAVACPCSHEVASRCEPSHGSRGAVATERRDEARAARSRSWPTAARALAWRVRVRWARARVAQANTGVELTNTVVTQCALHHFQYTTQQSMPQAYGGQAQGAYGAAGSPSQSVQSVE